MKAKRKEFLEILKLAKNTLAGNPIHPILGCFCFTGKDLITFNGIETSIIPCKTDFMGGVPAILSTLVSKYRGEFLDLQQKDGILQLKCGKSKDELVLAPKESFLWEDFKGEPVFKIAHNENMQEALSTLLVCASKNALNIDINGVYLIKRRRCVQIISSNGDVIGIKRISSLRMTTPDFTLLIPYHFIELCAHLDYTHQLILEVYGDKIICLDKDSGCRIIAQLTETSETPQCLAFMEEAPAFLKIKTPESLVDSLERAVSLEKNVIKPLHFKIEQSTMTLSIDSPLGHVEERFVIDSENIFEVDFNGTDLLSICGVVDTPHMEFCDVGDVKALLLRTGDSKDDYKFLISSLVI